MSELSVGIRDPKTNLSKYKRRVKSGPWQQKTVREST